MTLAPPVLTSPKAAAAFGVHLDTLRRWCRPDTAVFIEGQHFTRRFPTQNGARLFNVTICVERLRSLGYAVPSETLAAYFPEPPTQPAQHAHSSGTPSA